MARVIVNHHGDLARRTARKKHAWRDVVIAPLARDVGLAPGYTGVMGILVPFRRNEPAEEDEAIERAEHDAQRYYHRRRLWTRAARACDRSRELAIESLRLRDAVASARVARVR